MYYDQEWGNLTSKQKQEIKKAHGGAGTGAKKKWKEAKERANNRQKQSDDWGDGNTLTGPIKKPETPKPGKPPAAPKPTPTPAPSTPPGSGGNPPTPEELGMKYKDENYYKAIGVETKGAASEQRAVEARAAAPQKPQSEAAQRVANNKAIIADRGSANRVAYEKELKDLKASTGYGAGGSEDIRGHLREKIEGGWKVSQPLNDYTGTSWFRQEGATGNQTAMERLKQVAYGDTPMSFTDLRRMGDEGYVPMAERAGTVWRDYTPGGGSDKEGYFKGMYDLNLKYGYTDKSYEDWNNDRIQGNRQLANRHGNAINRQEEAGLIDKYGNPTPQY